MGRRIAGQTGFDTPGAEVDPFELAGTTILTLEAGTSWDEQIQEAVDASDPFWTIFVNSIGTGDFQFPLRLRNEIGLKGSGRLTNLASNNGGALIIVGADRPLPVHAAPILDDADFSYSFGLETPRRYLDLSQWGFRASAMPELWIEMPIRISAPMDFAERILEMGGDLANATGYTYSLRVEMNGDFQNLNVSVKVGSTTHVLTTTAGFPIGTRRMLAIALKNNVLYVFVDGVIQATVATVGTFNPPAWESLCIAGALFQGCFPVYELLSASLPFEMGGFLVKSTARYTANYAVSWTKPAPTDQDLCSIWCEDERERDSLLKLGLGGNNYAWMQVDNAAIVTSSADVRVEDFSFSNSGGIAAQATGVHVLSLTRGHLRNLEFNTGDGMRSVGNSYYALLENLNHYGPGRCGLHWVGGASDARGLLRSSGPEVGISLQFGGKADLLHTFDYGTIGVLLVQCNGGISEISAGDEGLAVGVDPLYSVYIKKAYADPCGLTVHSLGVVVTTSDVTKPIGVEGFLQNLNIKIGQAILPGLTTEPAELIHFPVPDETDPIWVDARTLGVPTSLRPEKILTPFGSLGPRTLTAASVTLTARDGLEYDFTGVILVADIILTLGLTEYPQHGGRIIIRANPTFAGFTITIKNHDGVTLRTFAAAGQGTYRWKSTGVTAGVGTGDWSEIAQ